MKIISKKYMRTVLATALLAGSLVTHKQAYSNPIILTSRVLKFIDGMPRAMDGHTILDMKIIGSKIRTIVIGILNQETKKRVGLFDFQDKKVSLQLLARIEERIQTKYKTARDQLEHEHMDVTRFVKEWQKREHELLVDYEEQLQRIEEEVMVRHADDEKRYVAIRQEQRAVMRKHNALLQEELNQLKEQHIRDFDLFTTKLEKLEHQRAQQLALLQPALAQAKIAFMEVTLPFMEQARGSKDFMVTLIEEWAEKAGHKDSMLLRWSEEADGTEMKMFEHDITSCIALNQMCSDLLSFLDAMIASCPKAIKQYNELKDKLSHPHESH